MREKSFINEKEALIETSKDGSGSLLRGFHKKYHSLHQSLQTLIDSISITSPADKSFKFLSRSRVSALVHNIIHELSQLQEKNNNDACNSFSSYVRLGAKFQNISRATEKLTLVASQLIFDICWNEINEAGSNQLDSTCDAENDNISSSTILTAGMEFLSLVFGSFDYNVVYEILRKPFLYQKDVVMPFDLLFSIITSDCTIVRNEENDGTSKKGIVQNHCQPDNISCSWISSKMKSHAMLTLFRGLHAAEFIHHHIKSSHLDFPDHPINSASGNCMGLCTEPENLINILNRTSYLAIEYLSQGEEGWKAKSFVNGCTLAFEALGYLCTTIRCCFDGWINLYNENRDCQNLEQKQQMKILDRFALVLLRYSNRFSVQRSKQPELPKNISYVSIELSSFSLLLLMEWRSYGMIEIIHQESQTHKTEIINRILEEILSHSNVSESKEEISQQNIFLQALFNLSWTKNEMLFRICDQEGIIKKVQHYVTFLLSRMSSTEATPDCHYCYLRFIQIMHLFYKNRFRKILFESVIEIERNQNDLRVQNSDAEILSNKEREHDGFGGKTLIPYLTRLVLNQHFASAVLGICVWRILLFGQCSSYRNDTLSLSLWETLEASSQSNVVNEVFFNLVGLISDSEMHADCSKNGLKKILNFVNLPILCATGDLVSLFFSSKKCCLQVISYISQNDHGVDLINTIGSVFQVTNTWYDITRVKDNTVYSSEYKSQTSSLASIFTVGESSSSSLAQKGDPHFIISQSSNNADFDLLQCTFTITSAMILGRIVRCCMERNSTNPGICRGSPGQSRDSSFVQIKGLSHHLLREFVGCALDDIRADLKQSSMIEVALSQIRSRDLSRRTILLQNILFHIFDEEVNIGDSIFEKNLLLTETVRRNDQDKESLKSKYNNLQDKQRKLEQKIILAKSISEKEKTRAIAHAKFDAMELVEAHSQARTNSEQTAIYYKEKLSIAELDVQKVNKANNENLRIANEYSSKIQSLERELRTKEDRINCMEVDVRKKAEEISRNHLEIKTLSAKVIAAEDNGSILHKKNSDLQNDNKELNEKKEDSFFKLIALAQAYEQKEDENRNMREKLLDEVRMANDGKQTFQKKYDQMKKKACEFMDENEALKQKLEKMKKKLHEAIQRRPVGPVSYMNSLHDESHVMRKSQRNSHNDELFAERKLQRNSIYDESRVERSHRFNSQNIRGKENDLSIASSRRTKEGRKSNWKIVK